MNQPADKSDKNSWAKRWAREQHERELRLKKEIDLAWWLGGLEVEG